MPVSVFGPKQRAHDPFADALLEQLPRLRRYARALTGNATAADDLVQDCIERALRRAHSLQDPTRIAGWLRSILHNLFIDEIRRRRHDDHAELTEIEDVAASQHQPWDVSPGNIDFIRAMTQLSLEHRQILLLSGLEGLSYREIATELELPMGTVMSRLARARENLRRALDGETVTATNVPLRGGAK